MNSFSSISVMISVLMINENGLNVNGACLPEGCWYDIDADETLDIFCEDNGRTRYDYYDGNNGCNDISNYKTSFRSNVINDCCSPQIQCNNVYDCDTEDIHWRDGWYCGSNNICIPDNPCFNPVFPSNDICFDVGTCSGGCICDGLGDDDNNHGVCVPGNDNLEGTEATALGAVGTVYSVTVNNRGTEDVNIGIFQTNPTSFSDNPGSLPVVFASQAISSGGSGSFSWSLDWGLSWSSGAASGCTGSLSAGIVYSATGRNIEVSPEDTRNNEADITYNGNAGAGDGTWDISAGPGSPLDGESQLLVRTDGSFENSDADNACFTVCVTLKEGANEEYTPVFVVPGIPNNDYKFTLTPTYYISRYSRSGNLVVSESSSTQAHMITFGGENGNDITLCLNDFNEFEDC